MRNGTFFKKVGLLHVLIAIAYGALILISYFFGYDSEGLSWGVSMMAVVNFAIPFIFYKIID